MRTVCVVPLQLFLGKCAVRCFASVTLHLVTLLSVHANPSMSCKASHDIAQLQYFIWSSTDIHTYIQTDIHTYRQTDRQIDGVYTCMQFASTYVVIPYWLQSWRVSYSSSSWMATQCCCTRAEGSGWPLSPSGLQAAYYIQERHFIKQTECQI